MANVDPEGVVMESSFSLDYKEARERFVQAAAHAGATCDRRVCAARGPDG
ncbi:MAG: DUF2817 domain-containing protein, partial [Sinobacteraceae bacterium]|nr:DUF2817 domain-containing protein [Nevskiaceae bacterium]